MSRLISAARIASITFPATILAGGIAFLNPRHGVQSWSIGTAYAALFLIAWALVLGPINVIGSRPNPVHSALRRDVGISAGVMSIAHTMIGLQVHMGGVLSRYFLRGNMTSSSTGTLFLAANWAGLASVLMLACVTAVSNDPSLRTFGLKTWKTVQRFVYPAAALAVAHGFAYQVLEKRSPVPVTLIALLSLGVVALQLTGARLKRRELRSR